jgi:peptide/nickel transport system substrate-binding protein
MASMMLMHSGVASAQTAIPYKPTKRGGGGTLKLLWWQGPVLLNPQFATGTKEQEGSRIFYEPLAAWDADGNLVPVLATEIPSVANGGLAADGRSVVWKLKRGVTWHDGQPFTADDVVFNWEYHKDPATSTSWISTYRDITVTKVDSHTVRIQFPKPTPFWAEAFVGTVGMIIPRHVFKDFMGTKSREAPANTKPVGTGPYKIVDFKPGDLVLAEANTAYHIPNRPHFDRLEMKGGGDATSAARAVLQTGEYDFAGTLLVEDEVLQRLERGGRGRVAFSDGGTMEFLLLNPTDPTTERDGERSHPDTRHPLLSDPAVRRAIGHLIDRDGIQQVIYGRTAVATPNIVHNPARFRSPNLRNDFSIDKANAVLDAAGWARGAGGVRQKDGRALRFLFTTTVNASRQKTQTVIKSAFQRAGIEVELKAVTSAVFFSADVANPDTNGRFHADLMMYASGMGQPDPARFMDRYVSWEASSKANKWQGRNVLRWKNAEYDRLYKAAEVELDPARRAALFVQMNDLVCRDGYLVPLLFRRNVSAVANNLVAPPTGWDLDMSTLADWYRRPG